VLRQVFRKARGQRPRVKFPKACPAAERPFRRYTAGVPRFYFLSLTLRTIPVAVAYAVWSGAGVAMITLIAWALFGQRLDGFALFGIGLIVAGVLVIHLLSTAAAH
jgi:hypothetical protein